MDTTALPVCPKCKQTDQIQKVSSVYGLNTKEWYETRHSTDADGNMHSYQERHEAHTSLGLRLKPPQQPPSPTHPGLWYGIGGFVALILLSTICPIAFVPLSFAIPLIGASAALPDMAGIPAWMISTVVIGGGTICVGAIGIGLLAWLIMLVKRRFDKDMQNYKGKKTVYERDDLPRWQRAKARWDQLYYCLRDETVFIPAENKAIRAEDMEKYLYDSYFMG